MKSAPALVALLACGAASAQWEPGIGDAHLIDPWVQAKTVALTLPAGDVDGTLGELDDALSGLRVALENAAISIAARPEFSYEAAGRSFELSQQVGKVEQLLDDLFRILAIAGRPDVKSAQDGIASLRENLAGRTRFERDVVAALGSGSRTAIQALAARWWTASERVEDLRQALAAGRERRSG